MSLHLLMAVNASHHLHFHIYKMFCLCCGEIYVQEATHLAKVQKKTSFLAIMVLWTLLIKVINRFSSLLIRLQTCFRFQPRQYRDWSMLVIFHQSVSGDQFASKNNRFTTSLKVSASTIIHAWSRQCEIQQENVYAA